MEAMAKVFTKEFLEKNKDLDNMDAIYAAAVKEDSSITRAEFDEFMTKVSDQMASVKPGELDEKALESVAGGITWEVFAAISGVCYGAGYAVGQAIYHWRNR